LRGLRIKGVSLGTTQARLNLRALGEGWPEALLDVMAAAAKSIAAPT
jgi:hypothetical protein